MKESLKEYLLTPQKEGFFSATKDSDAEEQRTSLSDRKILLATGRQQSSGHKPPFRKNHNLSLNGSMHQGNQTYFMGAISPCYSSSNDPSSVILQIPPLNQHQMLTSLAQGFSPLKQETKLPNVIGSTALHALSSTNPFKYNFFNSSSADSPMHPYLQACAVQQQDNEPQFSENNQLIKLACENITAALRKDNPLVNGSIILKKPRFLVEFQDKNFMKDFQDSEFQKEVIRQLDFSNSFFCYDIPVMSDKHKHLTHSKKTQKLNQNAKQYDNESVIVNPSSKVSSSATFQQFPKKQLASQSPQYYGYPFPGYFVDSAVPQMQIQPRVLRNDDKQNISKSATNKLGQPDKSGKLEEADSKIGKILFKRGQTEDISKEGEDQCEDHCQITKHQEKETKTEDSAQVKSQLSTVKKSKNEDILNQKRRHFDTPNSKKYDPSTPSTKKKCLEENSCRKQVHLQAFSAAASRQENEKNDEIKQDLSEEKQKCELKHHESENEDEDEESYQEEIEDLADENSNSKKECCGCKKTKCLKLYCECFQAKRYCVGTNCQGCHNRPEFEDLRQQAMESIQQRNNSAFEPKVDKIDEVFESTSGQKIHSKGCNCKKSDCRKKYCECFQMGAKCTHLCKCQNCKNGSTSASAMDPNAHPVFFVDSNTHPPHFRGHPQQPYCYYPPQRYGPYGQQWSHPFYQPQDAIDPKGNRESDFMDYEDSQPQPDPIPKFSNRKTKINQNNGANAIPLLEGTNREK